MIQSDQPFFIGRDEELQQLFEFYHKAMNGQACMTFVGGEAGIGKTFLVEEFFRQVQHESKDLIIARSKCTIDSASYLPFRSLLENLLANEQSVRNPDQKSKQVVDIVMTTLWKVGPDMLGVFGIPIKILQVIAEKLGWHGKKELPQLEVPKDLDLSQVLGWYTKVMKNIASEFPLLLFIDDLHWADPSSLDLLLHLGMELEQEQLLIIGTYRPHETEQSSLFFSVKNKLKRRGAQEISLDISQEKPDDLQKASQFVHDYMVQKYGTNVSDEFEQLLTDRCEGNPLFLAELLTNMEEKGQIGKGSENINFNIDDIHQLPGRLDGIIQERIGRLDQSLQKILNYACVQGDDFFAQVIAHTQQLDEEKLIDDLTERLMETHQLIWERGERLLQNGLFVDIFAFKHNLIREFVYARLPRAKKWRIHAKIGEYLERLFEPNSDEISAELALHFYCANCLEKAVYYCLKAAARANRHYGYSEAIRFGTMGLEALEKMKDGLSQRGYASQKLHFLLELAKAEEVGGNRHAEKDHIQAGIDYLEKHLTLIENMEKVALQAEIYTQLGRLYRRKDAAHKKAKEYLEKGLSIYEQQNDRKNTAETLYHLALIYPFIPIPNGEQIPDDKSIETLKKSLIIAEQLRDIELQVKCLSDLTWKYESTLKR